MRIQMNYVCVLFTPRVHTSIKYAIDFIQHKVLVLSPWLPATYRDSCFIICSLAFLPSVIRFVKHSSHQHHSYCVFWKFILLSTCFDLILDSSRIPHDYRKEIISISVKGSLTNCINSRGGQTWCKVQIFHPHQFFPHFSFILVFINCSSFC